MSTESTVQPTRRVMDDPMRMFHGLLAACFTGAYLTSASERLQVIHAGFGYSMLALLIFRLAYGFLGPRSVRWSSVVQKLHSGWIWLRTLSTSNNTFTAHFRSSQNFGMTLATSCLLLLPTLLIGTGHVLYVSTVSWLEGVHELLANVMLMAVITHVTLLMALSLVRGRNLISPMWSGRIGGSGPDLIGRPRTWLAWILLLVSGAFGVWAVM